MAELPATKPTATIALLEKLIVKNLHRKDLTPEELAGYTARYAGLLKKAGLVP